MVEAAVVDGESELRRRGGGAASGGKNHDASESSSSNAPTPTNKKSVYGRTPDGTGEGSTCLVSGISPAY